MPKQKGNCKKCQLNSIKKCVIFLTAAAVAKEGNETLEESKFTCAFNIPDDDESKQLKDLFKHLMKKKSPKLRHKDGLELCSTGMGLGYRKGSTGGFQVLGYTLNGFMKKLDLSPFDFEKIW